MSTMTLNGKPQRKQLSDQLDRLDGIIDALADALPDAVRDAVQEGTKAALHQVLLDLLSNPDTIAMLRQTLQVPSPTPVVTVPVIATPSTPSFWSRCKSTVVAKAQQLREKLSPLVTVAKDKLVNVKNSLVDVKDRVRHSLHHVYLVRQIRKPLAVSLSIGLVVLTVSYLSHSTATVLAGVGTTVSRLAVQFAWWCRKTAQRIVG